MKKFILLFLIMLSSLSLYAQQEPLLRVYMIDGFSKDYKIAEIENMRFLIGKNKNEMKIYSHDSLIANHVISNIDTLKCELDSKSTVIFSVYINGVPSSYVLADIDSIIFATPVINPPHITSIVPDTVMIGDEITIAGSDFEKEQGTGFVLFGNTNAVAYTSWGETELKVKILQGAKSGKVSVTVNGKKSNEVDVFIDTSIVLIGNQVWMTKNLDVSHYCNGDSIPQVTDTTLWKNLTTGAWCYYNNDPAMGAIYGKLYNWYAINDPRGLAPSGWHVASDAEWSTLTTYLGVQDVAGGKLKEAGTAHWSIPNSGATNESGFTALPGGYRDHHGSYGGIGDYGVWWSSSLADVSYPWDRTLYYNKPYIDRNPNNGRFAYSVRCTRD